MISANEDASLGEIALLEKHRIERVSILTDGKLVGIVSRSNLVQAGGENLPPIPTNDTDPGPDQ